jgi:hypothetical protein
MVNMEDYFRRMQQSAKAKTSHHNEADEHPQRKKDEDKEDYPLNPS